MKSQWWFRSIGALGIASISMIAPLAQGARTAVPGTVNYVEGQVSIAGRALPAQQSGGTALGPDQILTVDRGKAEVLLSPGVFVRVGSNSEIRMVSPELIDPKVEVLRGEAMVEVDQKPKQARLDIFERGADASLLKEGLYKFDADEARVQVIDGKAQVEDNGQSKEIGKGKELTLNAGPLKTEKFDRKNEDELYRWSDVRSGYLAQANEASARTVYVNGFGGWGPGWFWNPYFSTFSWLPGDGFFYSPFGYPFYSPGYVVYAPRFGGSRFYARAGGVAAVAPSRGAFRGTPVVRSAPAFHAASGGSFAARGVGRR